MESGQSIEAPVPLKTPAQQAFEVFIAAARTCPGSTTSEGAIVAEEARKRGIADISVWGESLIADKNLVHAVQNAALNQHRKAANGPRTEVRLPISRVENVVRNVFKIAGQMEDLSEEELREIYGPIYATFSDKSEPSDNIDDGVNVIVGGMLAKAKERKST